MSEKSTIGHYDFFLLLTYIISKKKREIKEIEVEKKSSSKQIKIQQMFKVFQKLKKKFKSRSTPQSTVISSINSWKS